MRRISCCLIFIVIILELRAQPTITYTDYASHKNLTFTSYSIDITNPGDSGDSINWDFSAASHLDTFNISYVEPSSTPYAADFPNANLARKSGNNYQFLEVTTSELNDYGLYSSDYNTTIPYSNPAKILEYPFNYNSFFTDDLEGQFTALGLTFQRTGVTSSTADAYGTLRLPDGVYSKVLRVHNSQSLHDTSAAYVAEYEIDIYNWYYSGVKSPLLQISEVSVTFNGIYSTSKDASYLSAGTISNITYKAIGSEKGVRLFPNPTINHLRIESEQKINYIKIRDITGRELSVNPIIEDKHITFDVSFLTKGIYFIEIGNENGDIRVEKFVRQ